MPPLSHGRPERQGNQEIRELITKTERSICATASVVMDSVRDTERGELSGFKASLQHRKPVKSESVRYETDEHNGDYGVRAMLTHSGSKRGDSVSLLTKVVADIELLSDNGFRKAEGTMSTWVERARFTGSVLGGYDLSVFDVNRQLLTNEEYLSLLGDIKETVDLISENHFSLQVEAQS